MASYGAGIRAMIVIAGVLIGIVLGVRLAFKHGGRIALAPMLARLSHGKRRAALLDRATAFVTRRGVLAVFLSRWLFSPLGPYANLATGAIGFGWLRFSLAGITGEAIWVGLYTSIGYGFAGNLTAASDFASSILGFLAAGAVAAGLGGWLITAMRQPHDAPFP